MWCKVILYIQIQLIIKHTALFKLVLYTYRITSDLLSVIKITFIAFKEILYRRNIQCYSLSP